MKKSKRNVIQEAKDFATKAHEGQFLKNASAHSFITHPERVVRLVTDAGGTSEEIAAAWLHDVVEDTKVTIEEIKKLFGREIAELVDGLTDPDHFSEHPHRIRKAWQAERVGDKGLGVKKVKLADQTVNTEMMGFDPPVGWDPLQRLEYVEGARLISLKCKGISSALDKNFEKIYHKAFNAIRKDMGREK